MKTHIKSKHCNEQVVLKFGFYANKSIAIRGFSLQEGEPMFTATVALDEMPAEGCVFLKGWSENKGIPEALVKAGVVRLTGRKVNVGLVTVLEAEVCDPRVRKETQSDE